MSTSRRVVRSRGSRYLGRESQIRGLRTRLHRKPGGTPSRASSRNARRRCTASPRAASTSWVPSPRSTGERKGPQRELSRALDTRAPRSEGSSGPAAHSGCDAVRL
eukprot:6684300-Alexandrium_andersonii.AAC.1